MASIDIFFFCVLLFSVILGAWRGLIYEVLSLAGWVVALVMARLLAEPVALLLPIVGSAGPVIQYFLGFAVVFVVTYFLCGLFAWAVKNWIGSSALRPADRTLGGLFGVARGWIFLVFIAFAMQLGPWADDPWWRESRMVPGLEYFASLLQPFVPDQLRHFSPIAPLQ